MRAIWGMLQALWTKLTQNLGAKLETLILLFFLTEQKEIYYLHENAREVDFCLLREGKITKLIQVWYEMKNPKTKEREVRALLDLGRKYKVTDLLIFTRDIGGGISGIWAASNDNSCLPLLAGNANLVLSDASGRGEGPALAPIARILAHLDA
jgi:hypothetical protein